MRWIIIVALAVAAVGASAWYLVERHKEQATIDEISKLVASKGQTNKRLASVRTTVAALNQLEHPNFYLAVNGHDLAAILKQQSDKGIPVDQASGFSKLTIKPGALEFGKAQVGLAFDLDAELKDVPISFSGVAVITSALALNGSKADVSPLFGQIRLTSVKYKRTTEHKIVVDTVSASVNVILGLLTRVVQAYSVPLDIGVAKTFDLQKLLSAVKEVHDVSAPVIPLNLSLTSGAILLDESGVSFAGTLLEVSPDIFAATVQELRDLAKGGPQVESSCSDCQMTMKTIPFPGGFPFAPKTMTIPVPDREAYQRCQVEKTVCELRKKLPVATTQGQRSLTPLQAYVLRQLKVSPNVDDQQLYALLADLLQPSVSIQVPSENTGQYELSRHTAGRWLELMTRINSEDGNWSLRMRSVWARI
jgi:hypothetical protein